MSHLGLQLGDVIAHPDAKWPGEWRVSATGTGFVRAACTATGREASFGHADLRLLRRESVGISAPAVAPPNNIPNCRDRTCSGAVYERSAASRRAMELADARSECAHLERRMVEMRDEAALEIAWLKRELQRNDPRLYKARYERRAGQKGSVE